MTPVAVPAVRDLPARDPAGDLLAGAARVDITPPVGTRMAGYPNRTGPSTLIRDRLFARALVLEVAGSRMGLLSLDEMAVEAGWVTELRVAARDAIGIEPGNLLVAATHTHSSPGHLFAWDDLAGPALEAVLGESVGPASDTVRGSLRGGALDALRAAAAMLRPATLSVGQARVEGVASNRVNPENRVDARCLVLALDDVGGEPIAFVVHFACHPTVLGDGDLTLSADFPGVVAAGLEAAGERSVALFLNGALGDVSTRYTRRGQPGDDLARLGALVCNAARRALATRVTLDSQVAVTNRTIQLPAKRPERAAAAAERLDELRAELARRRHAHARDPEIRRLATALEGAEVASRLGTALRTVDAVDVEVQVVRLGDRLALVAVPVEAFAAIGLAISAALPDTLVALVGPANGYLGYVPTDDAFAAGGYEADTALVGPGAAERLEAGALDALAAAGLRREGGTR